MKKYALCLLMAVILPQAAPAASAPSDVFDLANWKLQIPGPKEVKKLTGYSSGYFFLNADKEMVFHLDASEQGPTPGAHYVRSELRHLPNWKLSEDHAISGEFRVVSHLNPDKVTALQIHGITEDHSDAPPLLRIAVNKGDLIAALKPGPSGDKTDMIPLKKDLGSAWVKVDVTVKNNQLTIAVDGETKVTRDLSYWKIPNYFKAGCYPQATEGTVDVFFRSLTVR